MTRTLFFTTAVATALLVAGPVQADQDLEERKAEAREVTEQLFEQLAGELQAAMEAGGPTEAIPVCRDEAPRIKTDLSLEKGWEVTRVGTRNRNPLLGLPHDWQQEVLDDFEERRAGGESFQDLEYAEVVENPIGEEFRYMRAIGTQELCLNCHGATEDMSEEIRNTLAEQYPHDRATGYSEGDLRGAFSIRYLMD